MKKNIETIFLAFVIPLSVLSFGSKKTYSQTYISFSVISQSIENGIDFLYYSQLPTGEFKTWACDKNDSCYYDSSPFVTTFVLYSIKNIKDQRVETMTHKGIDFLLQEQLSGGIWSFWTKNNERKIVPDLDDMSTISFCLKQNKMPFDNNIDTIKSKKNSNGLFVTWLSETNAKNVVDCVVNANVLLYLQENDIVVCNYINDAIIRNIHCSRFYPDEISLYYMVSRAYVNNISCFVSVRDSIINRILNTQKPNGFFGNDMISALSICTLLNFNYTGENLNNAIRYLCEKQDVKGCWAKAYFFLGPAPYYGSEELTTALCIEALNKYSLMMKK